MLTDVYLEPRRISIYIGAFFTSVKPYFKNVLNSIELPLSSFSLRNSNLSWKNLQLWKLREKKSFVNNGTFFFRNSKLRSGMAQSINRSSHRRCSIRKGVFRNFVKLTGKHLCQSLSFNKVAGCNFIKKETFAQVFSYEFCEIS